LLFARTQASPDGSGKPVKQKKLIFVGFKKRLQEALLKPYKNAFFAADLKRTAGESSLKKELKRGMESGLAKDFNPNKHLELLKSQKKEG
jgi:hypothetical protein